MSRYRILKPISYVLDGKAVVYTHAPAAAVELPDEVAAALGDSVLNLDTPPTPAPPVDPPKVDPPKVPEPKVEKPAEPVKPEGDGGN